MAYAVMACWWRRITPSPRPREGRGASRLTGLSQRREAAIEQALKAKIEQRRAAREAQAAADRRELEAFKEQFLNAAREVFALIDADGNGSLTKTEIVDAVTHDKKSSRSSGAAASRICNFAAAEAPREGVEGAGHVAGRRDRRATNVRPGVLLVIRSTRRLLDGVAARFSDRVHPILTI